MSTIFEKIVAGEIPCTKVYEDEQCLAFLDIDPITHGHTLLIPKQAYTRMTDTPDDLIAHLFITAKQIMQSMQQGLGVDYVQLNVEGIEVPHFHIHLIPNIFDHTIVSRQHTQYADGQAEAIAERIRDVG